MYFFLLSKDWLSQLACVSFYRKFGCRAQWYLSFNLAHPNPVRSLHLGVTFFDFLCCIELKNISFMPLVIALWFYELYNPLLFSLYSCLLLSKPVQLSMLFSNLLPVIAYIYDSRIRIFIPNIQNGNTDIFAQVIKDLLSKKRNFFLIMLTFNVI